MIELVIDRQGWIRMLYSDSFLPRGLGVPSIIRASHLEPDQDGNWWADLSPSGGPQLGPFPWRNQALAAEREWLQQQLSSGSQLTPSTEMNDHHETQTAASGEINRSPGLSQKPQQTTAHRADLAGEPARNHS